MMKKKNTNTTSDNETKKDVTVEDVTVESTDGSITEEQEERREMERRGGDRRQDKREGCNDRRVDDRRKTAKDASGLNNCNDRPDENKDDGQQREISELKELLQRRQADFENYKKRVLKQQEDQKKFAIKDIALDIIQINDDLHRAIEASSDIPNGESIDEAHKSFVEGVSLISSRIEDTLSKYGVIEIDSLGKAFDPNFHEAVEIDEDDDITEDTVTKIYQKGFCIDEVVIRSTKVRVSRPGTGEDKSAKEQEKEENEK